jgi:hypothetical protein
VAGTVDLDGAEPTEPAAASAAFAAPGEPAALDGWLAGETGVRVAPGTLPPISAAPPPLAALAARVRAAAPAGAEVLVAAGPPPSAVAIVAGDLVVSGTLAGAGLLFLDGALDIRGTFDFTGLVVASGGVRVESGASLGVRGALWIGAPPGAALSVAGRLAIAQDLAALDAADQLLRLPRRAVALGVRDAG